MKKKVTKKDSNILGSTVVGAGLAGLAAVAYFFLGPEGKKHQKNVKSWAIKMKADVIEKLESARSVVGEPAYQAIIDSVAAKYEKSKKNTPEEIKALADDLKKHWKTISKTVKVEKPITPKKAKTVVRTKIVKAKPKAPKKNK